MTPSQPLLSHPKYRPDIDGLRAIAVLSVVAFHAFPNWVGGGFVGVDVFFVISGFLISTIIFENLEKGTFSFANFYARRVKRIFPSLLLVLAATFVFGWFALLGEEYRQLGKHVAAGAGFVSNFALWKEVGYFDNSTDTKPLLHLWSLGIEEQFYIFWPVLAWFASKKKFGLFLTCAGVLLISFALNISGIRSDAVATFYSPLTRFWELSAGGLLAYLTLHNHVTPAKYSAKKANVLSLAGLAYLIAGILFTRESDAFPGWWALLPVAGAFLVIMAGMKAFVNHTLLSNRIMVWFGLISYPLYLWHWPLLSYARIVEGTTPDRSIRFLLVLLSIALAYLTYVVIDKPIRFGVSTRYKTLGPAFAMAAVGCFGFSTAYFKTLSTTRLSPLVSQEIVEALDDWEFPSGLVKTRLGEMDAFSNAAGSPEVVLFGDSHIEQYGPRVTYLSEQKMARTISMITSGGCPPVPNVREDFHPECVGLAERVENAVRQTKSVHTLVIGACWNCYFIDQTSMDRAADDKFNYYVQRGANRENFRGGRGRDPALEEFGMFLKRLSKDYKVYVLLDNPSSRGFDPGAIFGDGGNRRSLTFSLVATGETGMSPKPFQRDERQVALEDEMRQLVHSSGAIALEQSESICPKGICSPMDAEARPIYKDRHHIRPFYIRAAMTAMDVTLLR